MGWGGVEVKKEVKEEVKAARGASAAVQCFGMPTCDLLTPVAADACPSRKGSKGRSCELRRVTFWSFLSVSDHGGSQKVLC